MFTFLHAADIHLDSPMRRLDRYEGAPAASFRLATRRAFENLVDLALSEPVDFVLIAGDLYDGDWQDYNTGLYLASQMTRLREAGIDLFLISGNHDAQSRISRRLKLPENVHHFPSGKAATIPLERCQVSIHGQSFATRAVTRNLARDYPPAVAGHYNIGLLHTALSGREGHEPYAPCTLEDLSAKGYDYWALGHVHRREILASDPMVVFSGNIQGRQPRETGPRGCMLVTVADDNATRCRFVPLDVVRWESVQVEANGAGDGAAVIDRAHTAMVDRLQECGQRPVAMRLEIKGCTEAHNELSSDTDHWCNEIRSAALDTGRDRIWIEKVLFHTAPPPDCSPEETGGAVGELLALMEELEGDPRGQLEMTADLKELERKLPVELKTGIEGVRLEDPEWIRSILAQVRPLLLGRLFAGGKAP